DLSGFNADTLRIVDVCSLCEGAMELTPRLNTLFFVPWVLNIPDRAARKSRFFTMTSRAYPAGAPAYLIDCLDPHTPAAVQETTVKGLRAAFPSVGHRHTLFIPAAGEGLKRRRLTLSKSSFRRAGTAG
ncbi:MAG: hypothetical protein RQ748_11575, partial [Elusimicrobiales bacterium]|nr:hypothetical protein [Elusimicrobiales bacterium]